MIRLRSHVPLRKQACIEVLNTMPTFLNDWFFDSSCLRGWSDWHIQKDTLRTFHDHFSIRTRIYKNQASARTIRQSCRMHSSPGSFHEYCPASEDKNTRQESGIADLQNDSNETKTLPQTTRKDRANDPRQR